MSFQKITYEVQDDIAIIAFNDPKTMNAAGVDTVDEMSLALERAGDEARCTIITGNGRGFCSGANLSGNMGGGKSERKPDAGRELDRLYNPFIKAIRTHPHPVITAVNGAAAGVGCSIALAVTPFVSDRDRSLLHHVVELGSVLDIGIEVSAHDDLGMRHHSCFTSYGLEDRIRLRGNLPVLARVDVAVHHEDHYLEALCRAYEELH